MLGAEANKLLVKQYFWNYAMINSDNTGNIQQQ